MMNTLRTETEYPGATHKLVCGCDFLLQNSQSSRGHYDSFGNQVRHCDAPVAETSGSPFKLARLNPYRYADREWLSLDWSASSSLGLSDNRARFYDPTLGSFLQTDPIYHVNLYSYTNADPQNNTDPSGKIVDTILDIGFIGYDIVQLAKNPSMENAAYLGLDVVGALVPFATGLGPAAKVAKGASRADGLVKMGQKHHAISTKIYQRMSKNPQLAKAFKARDNRFVTQAADEMAHRGYQKWHRKYDEDVVKWLKDHPKASPQDFVNYLDDLYKTDTDLIKRFPDTNFHYDN